MTFPSILTPMLAYAVSGVVAVGALIWRPLALPTAQVTSYIRTPHTPHTHLSHSTLHISHTSNASRLPSHGWHVHTPLYTPVHRQPPRPRRSAAHKACCGTPRRLASSSSPWARRATMPVSSRAAWRCEKEEDEFTLTPHTKVIAPSLPRRNLFDLCLSFSRGRGRRWCGQQRATPLWPTMKSGRA
jgi:hypothetical protein